MERPSVSPELNLGLLRACEGWEEKGPAVQEGKYLFNSSKTRSLPRNAPSVPHWLYWEKLKTIALRHTTGADVFNSSLLTSSSFSSPPVHPPTLSAGIQQWECDGEGWSRALPQCQSHPSELPPQPLSWTRLRRIVIKLFCLILLSFMPGNLCKCCLAIPKSKPGCKRCSLTRRLIH